MCRETASSSAIRMGTLDSDASLICSFSNGCCAWEDIASLDALGRERLQFGHQPPDFLFEHAEMFGRIC